MFGFKFLIVSTHSLRKTFLLKVWLNNNEKDKALLYLSELFNHLSPAITKQYLGIRQEELEAIYFIWIDKQIIFFRNFYNFLYYFSG
jgi:hypothetical protein